MFRHEQEPGVRIAVIPSVTRAERDENPKFKIEVWGGTRIDRMAAPAAMMHAGCKTLSRVVGNKESEMHAAGQRVPFVIESTGRGEREMDIYSRLLKDRVVFLTGGIDDEVANLIIAQLLFLSNEDPKSDVHLYINSPGGSVSAGLAIYDTIQYLRCDVATYNVGMSASMGAIILCGGTKGKRYLLPNSRTLLHQPLIGGVMQGSATDLSIEAEEIIRLRRLIYSIISSRSGKDVTVVEKDCDRNKWLDARETVAYGLADRVLERMPAPVAG